jgi:hypothetical protein
MPATLSDRLAVAVMSFNRPQYLERVLQTVVSQLPTRRMQLDFFLFQDGALSPRTNTIVADTAMLKASETVFTRHLPQGAVFTTPINLGVALNFDRAERTIYEEFGYDAALFLEDDLVLQPGYFRVIERLLDLTADRPDIGMVSARGFANQTPLSQQHRQVRDLCLMDEHNWAFAMHRKAWAARDTVLQPYLELMRKVDYRERDKGPMKTTLHALQRSFSRHGAGYLTSQDSMKNMAFELLSMHRVSTFVNMARYIGKEGLHSTADKFSARGYGRTIMYEGVPDDFDLPSPEVLKRMRLGLQYR